MHGSHERSPRWFSGSLSLRYPLLNMLQNPDSEKEWKCSAQNHIVPTAETQRAILLVKKTFRSLYDLFTNQDPRRQPHLPCQQVCLQTTVSDLRWEPFCTYHNSHHSSHFPEHKWEDNRWVVLHTLSCRLLAATPRAGCCVRFIAEIIRGVEIVYPNNTQLVNSDHQNS